jgi:hypothetical protein
VREGKRKSIDLSFIYTVDPNVGEKRQASYHQKSWATSWPALRPPQVWALTLDFMTGLGLRNMTMSTNKPGAAIVAQSF